MQRILPILALVACLAIPLYVWVATKPPSDEALMRRFAEHESTLRQLAGQASDEGLDFFIGVPGPIFPSDLAERGVDANRIAAYRRQIRAAGVASISAASGKSVAFQAQSLVTLGPVKSLLYSPTPPLLTDTATEAFRFDPGAFRHVCRPLAEAWYLCLDYED